MESVAQVEVMSSKEDMNRALEPEENVVVSSRFSMVTDEDSRPMRYADISLSCGACGQMFVFSAGEQIFFCEKSFRNLPKRCKDCRAKRGFEGVRYGAATSVICAECGVSTTVPFRPTKGTPVLCRPCFELTQQSRTIGLAGRKISS